ncbi:MAG: serine O-acetyltransferase, partial [Fibrobacter sp.]|nr:serine O-acetyltransferase [Fibrobacter sp.]
MTLEEIEKNIREEAEKLLQQEPLSILMINEQVSSRKDFAEMLSVTLSCQLAGEVIDRNELEKMFRALYEKYPELLTSAAKDLHATVMRDPACTSYLEPLLFFKGFQGLQAFRAAHILWGEGRTFPAKMLQSIVSRKFGMDIHPAAKIGHGILVDHATNIVIGETAVVGNNVSFLHG